MKKNLFEKVKLLVLDVDGVLTRGEIIYDDQGRELKVFNVKDGLAISLLSKVGIKTILLSARDSAVLKKRAADMNVAEVIAGILPKESVLGQITQKYKVKPEEICFMGDDLIDVGMIRAVGVGVAVADAPEFVRKAARYVTKRCGGQAAVREVIDCILKEQGLEEKVYAYLKNPH